jgi:hypothetical protein
MSHPFNLPKGKELLKRVAQLFTASEKAFVLRDSKIVFVCGGPVGGTAPPPNTMRRHFLDYAKLHLDHLRIFLAENAEQDFITHDEPEFHNIAEFEELIAEVSDCIVIFPESAGSYAELGFFSKNENLRAKILVAPDATRQGDDSFMHRGPINLIDQNSKFSPAVQIDYTNHTFEPIKQRLEKRIVGRKRKQFAFTTYANLTVREKLFAICEILKIFSALSFEGINYAFRSVFTNVSKNEVKRLLSILIAAGLVRRIDSKEQHFYFEPKQSSFMEFDNFNLVEIQLEILDYYIAEFPQLANLIQEARHVN